MSTRSAHGPGPGARLLAAILLAAAVGSLACTGSSAAGDDGGAADAPAPDGAGRDGAVADGAVGDGALPPDGGAGDGPPPALDECQSPRAEWVFCSGFEEGSKAIWDDSDGNPDDTNLLMEDPGPFGHAGNHVMRLRVPAGRGGADLVKLLPAHPELFARWFIKYEPGFDFTAANHGSGLNAGSRDYLGRSGIRPDGNDYFGSWIEYATTTPTFQAYTYYRGMYQDCADPNGSCWGDLFPCTSDEGATYCTNPAHRETVMPPTLAADHWYCVEMQLAGGTPTTTAAGADGRLDFWVDEVEIGPWTGLWLRTAASVEVDVLWLSLFHHADHSVAGVMFDRVVVSTSRIGCGG